MLRQLRKAQELQVERKLEFVEEHVVLTVIADRIETTATSPLPRHAPVAALAVPQFRYPQKQFVESPDDNHNL